VSQRRTLILVAAIAIGALASFLVWNYVNGIQDDAYEGAQRVPVYLIKEQIARGTDGAEATARIVKENIPRKFKPSNAIVSLEDISGKVAVSDLVPNQVVVSDMFVAASDPRAQQTFAERLKQINDEDMAAVTISVDAVRGVSGLIQPGDYVNMLWVSDSSGSSGTDAATESNNSVASDKCVPDGARMIYEKIQVLAVDKTAVPQAGETAAADPAAEGDTATPTSTNSGMLTLIVPTEATQWIISSANTQQIWLTLVAKDYKPKGTPPINGCSGAPGEDETIATPYGPKGDVSTD
jgi:Flp pilus assembly protein CpaB